MPAVTQAKQGLPDKKKGGFLGGNLVIKALVIIAVLLFVSVVFFGVQLTLPDLFWASVRIGLGVFLLLLVAKGIESFLPASDFSPTQRWKDKITRTAKLSKPFNVKQLYIRGEDMRVYSIWGNIAGLLFIPYLVGKEKTDKDGNFIYTKTLDKDKEPVKDKDGKELLEYARDHLTERSGEWLFIVRRGFWFFGNDELVRADIDLCSDIGEKVWIKCPNLVPIGDYFYPTQQWQTDILRIKRQHMAEALVETYEEFLDLVANITQMTLQADPNFRKIIESQTETLAENKSGYLVREQ